MFFSKVPSMMSFDSAIRRLYARVHVLGWSDTVGMSRQLGWNEALVFAHMSCEQLRVLSPVAVDSCECSESENRKRAWVGGGF